MVRFSKRGDRPVGDETCEVAGVEDADMAFTHDRTAYDPEGGSGAKSKVRVAAKHGKDDGIHGLDNLLGRSSGPNKMRRG